MKTRNAVRVALTIAAIVAACLSALPVSHAAWKQSRNRRIAADHFR